MSSFLGGSSGNEAIIEIRAKVDKLYSDISGMTTGLMSKLEGVEKQITEKLGKAGEKSGKTFFQKFFSGGAIDITKGFGMATGISAMVKGTKNIMSEAINSFMDFEFEMASVKAKANTTELGFRDLEEAARKMGRTTFYSATQSAEALKVLVEMGLNAYEAIEALPKVLTLATTEAMNLADAADIALGSMRGMSMATTDLDRIVDTIAYTAAKSASTVYSLGQALKVSGAAAHISGQSLEDVLSVLGGLSNQMIRSETAGFAVTQMIARLTRAASGMSGTVDETGSTIGMARQTIKSLNLELLTSEKVLKPLPQIFTDLKNKSASTLEVLRVFGVYTYKYALAAMNASDTINKLNSELTDTDSLVKGAAQRMAEMKLDTLKGDLTLAKNALIDFGIELSKIFSPIARVAVEAFTATIRGLKSTLDAVRGKGMSGIRMSDEYLEGQGITPPIRQKNVFEQAEVNDNQIDRTIENIRRKVSILRYDQFGLPIFEEVKIRPIETDRLLDEEILKREEAYEKAMTKVYSRQKVMSIANLQFQNEQQKKQFDDIKANINAEYDLRVSGNKVLLEKNFAYEHEITDMINEENKKRLADLLEVTAAQEEARKELLKKFVDSRSKEGIEEANKTAQNNARIAESFTRLSEGMKKNSDEYFRWKLKALDEQKGKELEIVKDTEEGKYLVEEWYLEQKKQLHYQEVERSRDLFGGAKVGLQKLADEGSQFGQIGEDWIYDLKSGFQSGFSTFFSDTLKGTKSWGESIKGLFTDIIGNILDSFAKAGSQLLANSLFNLLLGSFATIGTSSLSSVAHTTKAFDTSAVTKFPNYNDPKPYIKRNSYSSASTDNMVVNQSFNVNVTANDAQSVQQFFRRNGKIVQELAADGVNKSRRLKKVFRGNNE